uniref:E3 ubiquitin-protein ligase TRIM39-like n=1 Tax=Sinocyclocheilus anshuiensis TaxID=1608454 RepID=A0A671M9U3_9TELE
MTSFSSSLSGELLQCHICLEVLTDPVTTSCGHNFCNVCIEACWETGQLYRCPLCKEGFDSKPELKINVAFQKVVDLKSCLQCVTSFCETHLTNHKTAPRLKHDKPLEMFCRDDQTCLCLFCTETEHKTHNAVPIEEESGHKRTQAEIKVMIQDRCNKIKEIKNLAKSNKSTNERNKANKVQLFTDLIHFIERCQSELLEVMEQKQTAAETQAEEMIKELEQEITELERRNTELEQLSHTEDHLHLLQVYSSVCSPPDVKSWTNININTDLLNTDILDKALTCLKEKVNKELKKIHDISKHYRMDVILDPNTAHPKLILSKDGKQVSHGGSWRDVPNNPERFDSSACVLGKDGFSCGRFYFVVQVGDKTEWDLGMARESIERKGKITVCPEKGFWCIWLRNGGEYVANEYCPVPLSLKDKPQKVGVFVDYEEGLVSFYNVETKALIYSFTGQSFTEKIFPFFSPCNKRGDVNTKPLIIHTA